MDDFHAREFFKKYKNSYIQIALNDTKTTEIVLVKYLHGTDDKK